METLTAQQKMEQQEMFKEMFLTTRRKRIKEYNQLLKTNKLSNLVIKTSQQMIQDLNQLMKQGMTLQQAREIVIHNHIVEM